MKTFLFIAAVCAIVIFPGSKAFNNTTINNRQFHLHNRTFLPPNGTVYVIVDKSDYELSVYDNDGWYATYPVVFGNPSLADKKMEGDRNTPEGKFTIISKRIHDKWYRFMALDYPTPESWEKFKRRKQSGEIPQRASIGGGIGIHGTWPNEDYQIDRYRNWTLGCISMKNSDVDELYRYIPVGTKVIIRK
ncbi:MAG: L,D-transpeptidase family protein [Terrimonas sp.]|nr:L,D-transpeptidase family protein [Terrimonas sp.]